MRYPIFTAILLAAGAACAQTPAAAPLQFEVATIKPAPPLNPAAMQAGKMHVGMKVDAARVDIGYLSLADLIMTAYKVKAHQVVGPDWMKTERFDILAKMPEGATKEQVPEMLQGLLADRFKLTFHKDSRELPVYGLLVGKGGPKLKEASKEDEAPFDEKDKGGTISFGGGQMKQTANGAVIKAEGQPGTMKMTMVEGKMHMESTKATMAGFADMLSRFVGKPVVDMTELKGNYDVTIESLDAGTDGHRADGGGRRAGNGRAGAGRRFGASRRRRFRPFDERLDLRVHPAVGTEAGIAQVAGRDDRGR